MEHKGPKLMTPFDSLMTPPDLYTIKLMLPYTPLPAQRMLGIYIKFTELKYVWEHFQGFENPSSGKMLDALKDYMGPEEKEMMEQMEMMMNMMEMMKDQPDMSDMFGSMFGDMFHMPDPDTQANTQADMQTAMQKGDDTDE